MENKVVIDPETIGEVTLLVKNAYLLAGKEKELMALCQFVEDGFPSAPGTEGALHKLFNQPPAIPHNDS